MSLVNCHRRRLIQGGTGTGPNFFITGAAPYIQTAQALADALTTTGISYDVANITEFEVVKNNVKARLNADAFYFDPAIGYLRPEVLAFEDYDGRFKSLNVANQFQRNRIIRFWLPGLQSCGTAAFSIIQTSGLEQVQYVPNLINIGETTGDDNVWLHSQSYVKKVIVHPDALVINSGSPDVDLEQIPGKYDTQQNTTPPDAISDLAASKASTTSIEINFSTPNSVNEILCFDLYLDGFFHKQVTSGETITGLIDSETYEVSIRTRDIYLNTSESNKVIVDLS